MEKPAYIVLSGGFDPMHDGHMDYLEAAAQFGPVAVILNSDAWLTRKKGKPFMGYDIRSKILKCNRHVSAVWRAEDFDGTVCKTLEHYLCDILAFGNGGDRTMHNTPEIETCMKLGIPLIFGLGGQKIRSSSELIANAASK